MKKSIVAALVILALIVLISPGLVGKLAEWSVDEQLRWAAEQNEEVVVTAEAFDRGWFSSQGRHRVLLGELATKGGLARLGIAPEGDGGPTLIIDTRLDHGLIPVTSMSREDGSLMPGLGRAASKLSLETDDGEIVELPGTVFSRVGLDGGVHSVYELEPGSAHGLSWGAADIEVESNARRRSFFLDGSLASFGIADGDDVINLGDARISANLRKVRQGFNVGDVALAFDTLTFGTADGEDVYIGPLSINTTSALSGSKVNSATRVEVTVKGIEPYGDVGWHLDVDVAGIDADALGALKRTLDSLPDSVTPQATLSFAEQDLKSVLAAGVGIDVNRLDVALPQGTVRSTLYFELPETDGAEFTWSGALLDLEARAEFTIPVAVFEYVTTVNPDAQAILGMGFLRKSGDDYVMAAEYKKGLLSVNGAPMPVPLPGP